MELKGRIDSNKAREVCIRQNWYTRGNNEEYMNLLCEICDDWLKSANEIQEQVYRVAKDIYDHSDCGTEYSEAECIENIAHYILNDATVWFLDMWEEE